MLRKLLAADPLPTSSSLPAYFLVGFKDRTQFWGGIASTPDQCRCRVSSV